MRARLPWILFFISLALNISFVVGVLSVGHHKIFGSPGGERLVERLSEELALSAEQHAALLDLRDRVQEDRARREAASGSLSDFTAQVLAEAVYDPEAVRWVMIERSQPYREYIISMMGRMHAFAQLLDERQRQLFVGRIAEDRDFMRNLFATEDRARRGN